MRIYRSLTILALLLSVVGILLLPLHSSADAYAGCTDPFLDTTIVSSIEITPLSQWLFVLLSAMIMLALGLAVEKLRRTCSTEHAICVYRVLQYLCLAPEFKVAQRAIQHWRTRVAEGMHHCDNDQHGAFEPLAKAIALPSITAGRRLLYWAFHLPLLILASAPAFGFVLSQNVPAGGGWYWSILSNSMFVAGIKLGNLFKLTTNNPMQAIVTLRCSGFSEIIVPKSALRLALFRHAVSQHNILQADARVVITVNRRQVETMILFEVFTVS